MFSDKINEDYCLDGDMLLIKGVETFIPGILDKTVKAFKFFENKYEEYDYITRTNISKIVNFDLLLEELEKRPVDYCGANLYKLTYLHKNSTYL